MRPASAQQKGRQEGEVLFEVGALPGAGRMDEDDDATAWISELQSQREACTVLSRKVGV
jgi:hypothetical protein